MSRNGLPHQVDNPLDAEDLDLMLGGLDLRESQDNETKEAASSQENTSFIKPQLQPQTMRVRDWVNCDLLTPIELFAHRCDQAEHRQIESNNDCAHNAGNH